MFTSTNSKLTETPLLQAYMEDKLVLSYTPRYTLIYYRKVVISLLLQQCRVGKISTSALNVMSSLIEQVLTCCFNTLGQLKRNRSLPDSLLFGVLLKALSRKFMSTSPLDFHNQQYIDYLLSLKRAGQSENIPALFGQRSSARGTQALLPWADIEVIDS